ncbi:MAG: hypothetical protein K2N91_01425, partial [Muribaculaceae bacterium]|nr:hypothetical protein [Muribaculaceae bacterium]
VYYGAPLPMRFLVKFKNRKQMSALQLKLEELVSYLSNSKNHQVIYDLNKYPFRLRMKDINNYVLITEQILRIISPKE